MSHDQRELLLTDKVMDCTEAQGRGDSQEELGMSSSSYLYNDLTGKSAYNRPEHVTPVKSSRRSQVLTIEDGTGNTFSPGE